MATLPQNADVHYREAVDCLNGLHGPRMDALSATYQQEAYRNLVLGSIAQSLAGILALQLDQSALR